MDYVNVMNLSDTSGCGCYRMCFPSWNIRSVLRNVSFVETKRYILDPNFYRAVRHIMLQRQVGPQQKEVFEKFFLPLQRQTGLWITYNIDDAIIPADIPKYNSGWAAYQVPGITENIKFMMCNSDFVVTTTPELKYYFHKRCGVELNRIIDIPNYLPRWWAGESYNADHRRQLYRDNIHKPRIGFSSSSTHFDLENKNCGIDDFTHIIKFIESTMHKYQWVFIGAFPLQLETYIKSKQLELHPGSDILNFLRELNDKRLNVLVAPLQDNIFNRCKSNIKLIESWALGIPVIAQNLPLYSKYTDLTFNDGNDLQNRIDDVLRDEETYMDIISHNKYIVDYGDTHAPNGWWLEKNSTKWTKLFMLPQKSINIDVNTYLQQSPQNTKSDLKLEI